MYVVAATAGVKMRHWEPALVNDYLGAANDLLLHTTGCPTPLMNGSELRVAWAARFQVRRLNRRVVAMETARSS